MTLVMLSVVALVSRAIATVLSSAVPSAYAVLVSRKPGFALSTDNSSPHVTASVITLRMIPLQVTTEHCAPDAASVNANPIISNKLDV